MRTNSKRKIPRKKDMTVCVAAISQVKAEPDWVIIVNVADRMITAGSLIKYEPDQSKILRLYDDDKHSVLLMVAGSTSLQSEIINSLRKRLIDTEHDHKWEIKKIAELYTDIYQEIYFRRAESAVLVPQLLTRESYAEQNATLGDATATHISRKFDEFWVKYRNDDANLVSAIVSGIDANGPQIYAIENDEFECRSNEGFAAIGVGAWHAESQFMFKRFTRSWTFANTVLLSFVAKKRAEIAEGISPTTDLAFITRKGTTFANPESRLGGMKRLDRAYSELEKEIVALEDRIWRTHSDELETSAQKRLPNTMKANPKSRKKPAIPLTSVDFELALKKASRKVSELEQGTKETSEFHQNDDCNETQTR